MYQKKYITSGLETELPKAGIDKITCRICLIVNNMKNNNLKILKPQIDEKGRRYIVRKIGKTKRVRIYFINSNNKWYLNYIFIVNANKVARQYHNISLDKFISNIDKMINFIPIGYNINKYSFCCNTFPEMLLNDFEFHDKELRRIVEQELRSTNCDIYLSKTSIKSKSYLIDQLECCFDVPTRKASNLIADEKVLENLAEICVILSKQDYTALPISTEFQKGHITIYAKLHSKSVPIKIYCKDSSNPEYDLWRIETTHNQKTFDNFTLNQSISKEEDITRIFKILLKHVTNSAIHILNCRYPEISDKDKKIRIARILNDCFRYATQANIIYEAITRKDHNLIFNINTNTFTSGLKNTIRDLAKSGTVFENCGNGNYTIKKSSLDS